MKYKTLYTTLLFALACQNLFGTPSLKVPDAEAARELTEIKRSYISDGYRDGYFREKLTAYDKEFVRWKLDQIHTKLTLAEQMKESQLVEVKLDTEDIRSKLSPHEVQLLETHRKRERDLLASNPSDLLRLKRRRLLQCNDMRYSFIDRSFTEWLGKGDENAILTLVRSFNDDFHEDLIATKDYYNRNYLIVGICYFAFKRKHRNFLMTPSFLGEPNSLFASADQVFWLRPLNFRCGDKKLILHPRL